MEEMIFMRKRLLSILLCLVMVTGLLPTAAFAADESTPAPVYVNVSGNDETGDGTESQPYATLAKAVEAAADGATIYVMSNLDMTKCARFFDKHLTITSDGENQFTIIRGENFAKQQDNARSTYNPAMIEVQSTKEETTSVGLTLTNIILDDANQHEGTIFAQASSEEGHGDNTVYVQDAIIASNATVPCTITLGEGAVLRNFGGMSALRATDQAKIVMESGSVIEDSSSTTRSKGGTGSVGPAGAVWIQGGTLVMEQGSKIQNVNGRAVYADGGTVTIGGTISGVTANKNAMWQADNGTAIHLRNGAEGTLTSTALIENISGGGHAVYCADEATSSTLSFKMENGSKITNCPELKGNAIFAKNSTITIDGEISNVYATGNHILQTVGGTTVTIGENGAILNNRANYGAVYINGTDEQLNIYGKINGNICTDRGGGVVLSNNGGNHNAVMYPGAEICNNSCAQTGGGVMVSKGTFTMNGGTISGNISGTNTTKDDEKVGGGVFVRRGGQFIMNDGVIENNATTAFGGGVCFDASDNGGFVPKVELNGGTIKDNKMNAQFDDDGNITQSASNDLAISSTDYGKADRYLSISDEVTIGNEAVYFQTNTKTVTPADDSLAIKLGNTSAANVTALTTASTAKGWENPLATFWAQRDDGAATLRVGGLTTLDSNLPVYVLALPVSDTGAASDVPAQVYAAQETTEADTTVNFTLPDISGDGYAIAIVQPTADYGTLTISGPATIQEDKNAENYSVAYTVTYDVSKNMKSIIEQAGGTAGYSLTINQDNRLSGTPDTFDGNSIDVTYKLLNADFTADKSLFASAVLTITVGQSTYTIPSNVAETKMVGLYDVRFDWNDGTDKVETVSVADGQTIGTKMPADPTRSGYTFTGWNTQPDGTGTAVTKDTVVTGRLTAYAQWSKNSSGGGGGGGGNKKPVVIPDEVPTGLNGDDHYAYIVGYPDSTVRPQNGITRAEVATIFFRLLTDEVRDKNSTKTNSYSDVASTDWYNHAVSTLSAMGIIKGDTHGKFNPNAPITRAEFAAIAARFDDKANTTTADFSDIASHWAKDEISAAANNGWINGYTDGTFRPNNNITRAEAMTLVNRVLKRLPETAEDLHDDMIKWTDNSDTSKWYYLAVQEATNSHYYETKNTQYEKWTKLRETRDWTELEK